MQRWLDTTGKLSYHFSLSFGSSDDKRKTMDLGKELFGEEVITGFRDIRVARNITRLVIYTRTLVGSIR
jgi:hypothetical protein